MNLNSVLYESCSLPGMQNKLFNTKIEALSSPTANIALCQDETGLVFNKYFNPKLIHYDESYQNDQGHSEIFKTHLDSVISLCKQFVPDKSSKIVDIGCGKGGFVELLRSHEFNAVGYDNTYQGDSLYIKKSFFDLNSHDRGELLTLRHVLEHIPSPWDFIKEISNANSYHGFLYIEVPDLDWILTNNAYFDLFHEHVNYFRAQDFYNRYGRAVLYLSNTFGGQYLSVIIDLSLLSSYETNNFRQSNHSLRKSFAELSQSELRLYDTLKDYEKVVVWGAASKGVIFAAKAPHEIKNKILFSVDINPNKHGYFMPISGVQVLDPSISIPMLCLSTLVIIMNPNYEEEIRSTLPVDQPYLVVR
jgi:hypothetical protein